MIYMILGVLAFGLFFLYDINSVLWQDKVLHKSFFAGCMILAVSTVLFTIKFFSSERIHMIQWICLLLTIISFLLFIYTLFFALPFDKTYREMEGPACVYTGGIYSLCRHPGVLWMFFFYVFLGGFLNSFTVILIGIVYSILNIAYVVLQDCWTFPKTLAGYDEYKNTTPFLIPTKDSIKKCWNTIYSGKGRDDEVRRKVKRKG